MLRIVPVAAILSAFLVITFSFAQTHDQWLGQTDVAVLKDKRLMLLLERVRIIEVRVNNGQAARVELAEPMIDLIRAKIEYANSNDERRKLYDQWLAEYDRLIERAELIEKGPVSQEKSKCELLYLKSERLRIEIERESLD